MISKTTFISLILSILFYHTLNAQVPNFEWTKSFGGSDWDGSLAMTIDNEGNILTTGWFEGTVDFDPGSGIYNLTSNGDRDIYIQKLDPDGNFLWVKHMGGMYSDYGFSITTDETGNVITSGSYGGTIDFDPGPEIFTIPWVGSHDMFIQKLDSDGNFLWVKQMGGIVEDEAKSIVTDEMGNIYTCGHFGNTVDFDPGADTALLTDGGGFLQKLNPDGNLLWVKQIPGARAESMAIDGAGNFYITGNFYLSMDADPSDEIVTLYSIAFLDIFILKLDPNGDFVWVKQMGGDGPNGDCGESISLDTEGNVYTTGTFNGTADFNPGDEVVNLVTSGDTDIFIQKLDSDGNFLWVKQMGGTTWDHGRHIATDANGHVYCTGDFKDVVDFDPGIGTTNLDAIGETNMFIQKLDGDGNLIWVRQIGGNGLARGHSIIIDNNNEIFCTGWFDETVDFDPGSGTSNHTSNGGLDIFVLKLNQNPVGITENIFEDSFQVYPNPSVGDFKASFTDIHEELKVRILSFTGQLIKSQTFKNTNQFQMELDESSGIYLVEISNKMGRTMVVRLVKE